MRHSIFALFCLASSFVVAGCSVSIPLPSLLGGDDDVTGSIGAPKIAAKSLLRPISLHAAAPEMFEGGDWKEAKGSLALALLAQNAGESIAWNNAATGAEGSFTALGAEFFQSARPCRTFVADIGTGAGQKTLEGLACRDAAGGWAVDFGGAGK